MRQRGRLDDTCVLGLTRMPLPRHMGFGDWRTATKITRLASKLGVDALHGHVAKGGAYGLVAARFTVENMT